MKICIQRTWPTQRGVHLVTPDLKPKAPEYFVPSLYATRHLVELDMWDCVDEIVKLHLQEAYTEMTRAIYYAESVAK